MSASPHANPATTSVSALVQNLALIALVVMLAGVGLAYLVDQAGRADTRPVPMLEDNETIEQTVGGQELAIPRSWFRFGEQMQSGFVSQVDLSVRLPLGPEGALVPVDVTLLPRVRAKTSSELLDQVYVHQFTPGQVAGVPGLVGQRLAERDGYAGETVWYDALSPRPFVAKCIRAVAADAPDRCIRTVHLTTGLAAIYSFEATLLPSWRQFDAEISRWLDRIGAR